MTIGLIGIGLIGGSLGLDLKHRGFTNKVIGCSRKLETAEEAKALGLIDEVLSKDDLIKQSDLIILSVPVNVLVDELIYVLDRTSTAVVTDMGSTKRSIIEAVTGHPNRKRFVAAHPMAGTENSGPKAAFKGLFDDKVAIICDQQNTDSDAVKVVEDMLNTLKMRVRYMDAAEHDMHAAYVSHISHISSFVLSSTVLDKEKSSKAILDMAGGGFESTVRLAKSSPKMWSQIFEQNANNMLEVLDTYIKKMEYFRNCIEIGDFAALEKFMSEANEIKKILK
ncbi:MAG: prephenate dehydrogenase [Chitinophagales bacterium]